MLGYIISDKYEINVKNHKIKSFNILKHTNLNIFVIKNNKVIYINNIIFYASFNGHIKVLEWFKNSGYKFKYDKEAFKTECIKILKFYYNNIDIKKVIKWSNPNIFKKTIKFKTPHKYIKGYQKN